MLLQKLLSLQGRTSNSYAKHSSSTFQRLSKHFPSAFSRIGLQPWNHSTFSRVPTLVEDSTNVGTEEEAETSTETPEEFATTVPVSDKISSLKQAAITTIHIAEAMEKEFENAKQECIELEKLAKSRLEKVKSLESQLNKEKVTSTQHCQNLDKANEELQKLKEEKKMND